MSAAAQRRLRPSGHRSIAIAAVSTLIVSVLVGFVVVRSPGWARVRDSFFSVDHLRRSFPEIARRFGLNVRMFLIAEALVLVFGLLLAVARSLRGPAFFPLRAAAVIYSDVFRGVPTLLVVLLLGFGIPALQLDYLPRDQTVLCIIALVAVYTAYVGEVYRAGINSIHESQIAAARSLGLTQWQAMRYVVLPQAVRRVIPPLLNDFVGLQKDTALVQVLGPIEAARAAQIYASSKFNYTSYVGAALLFLAVTIPLARFTDALIRRDERRRAATAHGQ